MDLVAWNVRETPWLTPALALLALFATLALPALPDVEGSEGNPARAHAFNWWQNHGYLEADDETLAFAEERFEVRLRPIALAAIRELGSRARPQSASERDEAQRRLEELEAAAAGDVATFEPIPADHPLRRLRFSPGQPSALAFLVHPFVHVGWMQPFLVVGALLVFGLAAERSIGARATGEILGVAITSGVVLALLLDRETRGFFGAGAAATALLTFGVVQRWRRIDRLPAAARARARRDTAALPVAWALITLLVLFGLNRQGARDDYSVASELGGALAGLAYAFKLGDRRPARRRRPTPSARTRRARDSARAGHEAKRPPATLDEAWVALDMGETDRAYALFRRAARDHPQDPEVTRALWSVAISSGRSDEVARTMADQIRRQLRRGNAEVAAELWRELAESLPEVRLPAEDLFRLVDPLLEHHPAEFALAALRQCVDAPRGELSIGLALQILDSAETLDPTTALLAARRALELPDLHESKRDRILSRVRELDPEGPEARAVRTDAAPKAGPEPVVPSEALEVPEADPEDPPAIDLASLPRFDALHQVSARPTSLEDDTFYFELANGRRAKIAWGDVQAIAVAAVRDLAPKPVVLIDLLLNWNEIGDAPLRSIRLRSDQFDPVTLLRAAGESTEGLRALLAELLERSGAIPLPDEAAARGRPFRVYKFTRTYQRRVLKVDC